MPWAELVETVIIFSDKNAERHDPEGSCLSCFVGDRQSVALKVGSTNLSFCFRRLEANRPDLTGYPDPTAWSYLNRSPIGQRCMEA